MGDLVSIITPSYNTARFIAQTIESVLAQTYTDWEMIIVDDCSTDNTDEVVASFQDDRIKYVKNAQNSGAAVSRNRGLQMAQGRWIAFLDSDDLWAPKKLEKQIAFMEANHASFSYTNYREIHEDGSFNGVMVTGPKHISKTGMYNYNWLGCLTVMYDADAVGIIQIADIKKRNDYAMWLKVADRVDCYLLNEELAYYRKRVGSISNQKYIKSIKCHYELFRYAEKMGALKSAVFTLRNLFFGVAKKFLYVKKES